MGITYTHNGGEHGILQKSSTLIWPEPASITLAIKQCGTGPDQPLTFTKSGSKWSASYKDADGKDRTVTITNLKVTVSVTDVADIRRTGHDDLADDTGSFTGTMNPE